MVGCRKGGGTGKPTPTENSLTKWILFTAKNAECKYKPTRFFGKNRAGELSPATGCLYPLTPRKGLPVPAGNIKRKSRKSTRAGEENSRRHVFLAIGKILSYFLPLTRETSSFTKTP